VRGQGRVTAYDPLRWDAKRMVLGQRHLYVHNGIVAGQAIRRFAYDPIMRAMFVTLLHRLAGMPVVTEPVFRPVFLVCPDGSWFSTPWLASQCACRYRFVV
jgi:hypothetical protein